MKPFITGLVLTYNGERLLAECLDSLAFCDRVIVVDSFSTDATEAIAREAGAVFIAHTWEGPAAQFRFALGLFDGNYPTDWVISLDQDEQCTPELRDAFLEAVRAAEDDPSSGDLAGFYVPRCSWYYNRFLLHSGWYPDALLRCFRRGKMRVEVSGAHYSFHPLGKTRRLSGDIVHYPYASFREHLDKINSYAQQGAAELEARGVHGGIAKGLTHGLGRFLRLYVLKRGFLDGRAGFINAVHGAFYAFLKYVRIGEGSWGKPYSLDSRRSSRR